ncbi:hypothetical protein C900_04850 [Fulvivirga imtechensis AK7]|uniref:Phosphoglycerate mutase n=1 Tax=Fulvivirga imtechensis AK7 TaxID=1237149 RepID=L8JLD4_9BACT|nr:phosphoglycerate mutase family protein [Fulvivirga imtechensis]ELR69625.1 hypothetical protein C900_04850 [Fulvivirga imtechensis AK7]
MKRILLVAFGLLLFYQVYPQSDSITTVILVRHAEKDFAKDGDPVLTENGTARARLLAEILKNQSVDAVYSTPFNRTRQTVEPVASQKTLEVIDYNPFKLEEVIEIIEANKGKTLLISGHSNTVPLILNMMVNEDKYRQLDESDYDNLYIVSYLRKGNAKVLELQYGEVTNN